MRKPSRELIDAHTTPKSELKHQNLSGQRCPICEKGFLRKIVENETFTHLGHEIEISDCISYKCSICQESIVDAVDHKRVGKLLKKWKKEHAGGNQ
jgi:YgiT-type zinc finger domain-containing protein